MSDTDPQQKPGGGGGWVILATSIASVNHLGVICVQVLSFPLNTWLGKYIECGSLSSNTIDSIVTTRSFSLPYK
jgi:hypothetical protein